MANKFISRWPCYMNAPSGNSLHPAEQAGDTIEALRKAAMGYRACPLWEHATQTIFGEGPSYASIMLVGEHAESGPENRHRGTDQWLYVLSGTGIATVNSKRHELGQGVLILIERGDEHEIRNTGDDLLQSLNFYVPPAYTISGEELPRGRDS